MQHEMLKELSDSTSDDIQDNARKHLQLVNSVLRHLKKNVMLLDS